MMRTSLKSITLIVVLLTGFPVPGSGQNASADLRAKIDAIVTEAYRKASLKFPCKLGAHGKAKMLSWKSMDKCLNYANDRVDWEDLSLRIKKARDDGGFQAMEISPAIESSLLAHALPYDKVFGVKEEKALLPLSSSLLKFLPADSLINLPVYDNSGVKVGTFAGTYVFEKTGSLTGNIMRHTLFQYTDSKGNMQAPPDRLLLDSYGVPWKDAQAKPGFSLPPDKLIPKH